MQLCLLPGMEQTTHRASEHSGGPDADVRHAFLDETFLRKDGTARRPADTAPLLQDQRVQAPLLRVADGRQDGHPHRPQHAEPAQPSVQHVQGCLCRVRG